MNGIIYCSAWQSNLSTIAWHLNCCAIYVVRYEKSFYFPYFLTTGYHKIIINKISIDWLYIHQKRWLRSGVKVQSIYSSFLGNNALQIIHLSLYQRQLLQRDLSIEGHATILQFPRLVGRLPQLMLKFQRCKHVNNDIYEKIRGRNTLHSLLVTTRVSSQHWGVISNSIQQTWFDFQFEHTNNEVRSPILTKNHRV